MVRSVILVIIGALVGVVVGLAVGGHHSAEATAGGRTVTLEDCATQYGADGTAGPVLCPDGDVNMTVDHQLRLGAGFKVLLLGPNVSPEAVSAAICQDYAGGNTTGPVEQEAYDVAKAEYHWSFGISPFIDISQASSEC
jgi:hypothetical protein